MFNGKNKGETNKEKKKKKKISISYTLWGFLVKRIGSFLFTRAAKPSLQIASRLKSSARKHFSLRLGSAIRAVRALYSGSHRSCASHGEMMRSLGEREKSSAMSRARRESLDKLGAS